MHYCSVQGCSSRSDKNKDLSFYRLPHNEPLLHEWMIKARLSNITKSTRICSIHFVHGKRKGSDIPSIFPWSYFRKLPAVRPFINQVPASGHTTNCDEILLAIEHDHAYCRKIQSPAILSTATDDISLPLLLPSPRITVTQPVTQPEPTHTPFRIENIKNDNKLIHFYTGFDDYNVLEVCYKVLGASVNYLTYWNPGKSLSHTQSTVKGRPSRCLTPFNEFFLVLCRLRLGLLELDLAYRFSISQSTVSRICVTWINLMYCKFKEIEIWPCRSQIDHFMPQCFKESYPSTRCIVDATEIFIQQPSSPVAQQLTFSSYKNHNTFKAIVGITPSGAVSFISDIYGGTISDRELTEKCGILQKLEPGDSVMADKGFTIADILEPIGVSLNIPPRKLQDQFEEPELIQTRRIASIRIHVERAIGQLKSYRILNSIPNCMAGIANQTFFVCTMLTNFKKPLV